jgi:hypothetical protein
MKIAVTLNAHGHTDMVLDTVMSIQKYVTKDILMIVDGAAWDKWGKDVELPVHKTCGLFHNCSKSPYRNITYGLMQTHMLFPDADWYCYTEYDTVFASDSFKEDLERAKHNNTWVMGNDLRTGKFKFPMIERMLRCKIPVSKYMLGCCLFHNSVFIKVLSGINFFERFLWLTNDFDKGHFPGYEEQGGYDLAEHLYPTLAHHFGGGLHSFGYWDRKDGWIGDKRYMMRWKPELRPEEVPEDAFILHPLKSYDHPIRTQQRKKRKNDRTRI